MGQSAATSVAILGKGGVGKTALTALLTRTLVGKDGKLLVIDADPVVGLPPALGLRVARTMGDVRLEIIKKARTDAEKAKLEVVNMVDYMIFECLVEADGFALLAMGFLAAELFVARSAAPPE